MLRVATLLVAILGSFTALAADDATVERYNRACAVCHGSGAGGAPLAFNAEAWAPRLEKGMPVLLQSTVNGYNAMPQKGLCFDCSEDDFKALITYMSSPK